MGENGNGQSPPNDGQELIDLLTILLRVFLAKRHQLRQILRELAFQYLLTLEEREFIFAAKYDLSKDDIRAIRIIARGRPNKEILTELHCGPEAVERRVQKIARQLGVKKRGEIAEKYNRECLPFAESKVA